MHIFVHFRQKFEVPDQEDEFESKLTNAWGDPDNWNFLFCIGQEPHFHAWVYFHWDGELRAFRERMHRFIQESNIDTTWDIIDTVE